MCVCVRLFIRLAPLLLVYRILDYLPIAFPFLKICTNLSQSQSLTRYAHVPPCTGVVIGKRIPVSIPPGSPGRAPCPSLLQWVHTRRRSQPKLDTGAPARSTRANLQDCKPTCYDANDVVNTNQNSWYVILTNMSKHKYDNPKSSSSGNCRCPYLFYNEAFLYGQLIEHTDIY